MVAFKIIRGFLRIGANKWAIVAKKATTYLTAVRCRSNGQIRRMADTPPSPTESFIRVYIYFSRCFDDVREGCGCFQDNKGFSANWSREVGYCCKNATTYLTAVRCRSNGQKRRMADTPPSPTESFIGVGVEKHV